MKKRVDISNKLKTNNSIESSRVILRVIAFLAVVLVVVGIFVFGFFTPRDGRYLKGELASGPKSEGLIHYYNFDNNLNDSIVVANLKTANGQVDYFEGISGNSVYIDTKDNLKAPKNQLKRKVILLIN